MGGYGSTRWNDHATAVTADACQRLAVADVLRHVPPTDPTQGGWLGSISWSRGGHPWCAIRFLLIPHAVRLIYTYTSAADVKTDHDDLIEFEAQPRYFGGQQWYFRCPQCGGRASKLYRAPGSQWFACRHCNRLTYASCQDERKFDFLARAVGISADDLRNLDRLMRRRLK